MKDMKTSVSTMEQNRTVIIDVIRSMLLDINGVTGAEVLKGNKGLRECYTGIEMHLNYQIGKLPDDVKTVVRFEFDKLVSAYTSASDDWQLQAVRVKYGAKDGSAFQKRSASWRNDNVPVSAYPMVCAQLGDDIKRLEKSLAEATAIGNKDGAAKIAGRIRQSKNNRIILAGHHDEFVAAQAERKAELDKTPQELTPA